MRTVLRSNEALNSAKTLGAEHLSHMFVQGSHCLKCIEQSITCPTLQVLLLVGSQHTSTMHKPMKPEGINTVTTCAISAMSAEETQESLAVSSE